MTEVRTSASGHLGLFALKDFSSGDVILEEKPAVILAPSDDKDSRDLLLEWKNGSSNKIFFSSTTSKEALWNSIKPPPSGLVPEHLQGTFKGMVQAGIVFIKKSQDNMKEPELKSLLQLYHPTKESTVEAEKTIFIVADEAILYLQQHVTTSKTAGKVFSRFKDWDILHTLLLVWSCNSFQGGRVYLEMSRVNHSCNPNAVIQTSNEGQSGDGNNNGQKLLAAAKIGKGSEIFISYLGLLLYTDAALRKKTLERTKFFTCLCSRCTKATSEGIDGAGQIPCPISHPRDSKQMSLDEDTQYDDDQAVKYTVFPDSKRKSEWCKTNVTSKSGIAENEKLFDVLDAVRIKTERFLDTYEQKQKKDARSHVDQEEESEELEEHASLASTMMGDKHWTSNLTLLFHLDRRLKAMSQQMVVTQELPEEEDIAEAIDSLQRVSRYVDSLKLDIDPGHLLADVVIGTARMLISLGDEKSQKYGADWLSKIEDYVDQFSSEGLQKVVSVLKVAWKKHGRSNDDADGETRKKEKKQKT